MSDNETDLFATGSGAGPSAKFLEENKWVSGTILGVKKIPETDYKTGEPVLWPSGDVKEQPVVTLQTEERDSTIENDDGVRAIYCKWQIQLAIEAAIKETGHQGEMVGGQLAVCWSGSEPARTKGFNPMKLYKAKFRPPAETDAFLGEPPADGEEPF